MRESHLVRIDTDDPVRIWGGVGDLFVPADDIEPDDSLYSGAGELLDIPDFQQLINGIAERIDIKVSGVARATAQFAHAEAGDVKGRSFHIGEIRFDDDYQTLGAVEWIAEYRIDSMAVDSMDAGIDGDGGRSRTITLSLGSDDTGRSRTPNSYFTDADQHRRSATDKFFDHIAGIELGTSRRFGPTDA